MKKTTLAMTCLVALALLASCNKNTEPTVSVFAGAGYATQGTEVYSGDEINVGFTANGKDLVQFEMTASENGAVIYRNTATIDNEASYNYSHTFVIEAEGAVTITGTVTDANGQTATKSFDIACNEKPNAKFVGHYEGDALLTGTYNLVVTNMDPMEQEFENQPFAAVVNMVAGDDINKVLATITFNDQTTTAEGTVSGNTVVFDAVNTTFTLGYEYNGMTLNPSIEMTYNITATLEGDQLMLDGDCEGSGEFNVFIVSGNIELEATIGGALTKTE